MITSFLTFFRLGMCDLISAGHSNLCKLAPSWGNPDSWSFYWYMLAVVFLFHGLFAFVWAYKARQLAYDSKLQGSWCNAL